MADHTSRSIISLLNKHLSKQKQRVSSVYKSYLYKFLKNSKEFYELLMFVVYIVVYMYNFFKAVFVKYRYLRPSFYMKLIMIEETYISPFYASTSQNADSIEKIIQKNDCKDNDGKSLEISLDFQSQQPLSFSNITIQELKELLRSNEIKFLKSINLKFEDGSFTCIFSTSDSSPVSTTSTI
jgi:hypothetical protein